MGRIRDIIDSLEGTPPVRDIDNVPPGEKLRALCDSLEFTPEELDDLLSSHSQVVRTIKGHAFEVFFDHLMGANGLAIEKVGGDEDVDRMLNGFSLQLKTPTKSGTRGDVVVYKTHKTHGPKSELESEEYYRLADEFADFLVGLVSYDPVRILVLGRDSLPRHPSFPDRIRSPFTVKWRGHPGLNAFGELGVVQFSKDKQAVPTPASTESLPKISRIIGVTSEVIVDTICQRENFRIWDMNVLGFAREYALRRELQGRSVTEYRAQELGFQRADKVDIVLKRAKDRQYVRFQVKGVTKAQCSFAGADSVLAIETQLSRGRVSDHPTQSRLYLASDFDYVILTLEPAVAAHLPASEERRNGGGWRFFLVPTSDLQRHHVYTRRLKSMQKIPYTKLREYDLNPEWFQQWSKLSVVAPGQGLLTQSWN